MPVIAQENIKNRFPLPIVVKFDDKTGLWIFDEPFCYVSRKNGVIWIERTFKSDFTSIPQVVQNIYRPTDPRWIKASIPHDGLYASELLPRKTCDWIFLEALQDDGANWFDRNIFYSMVRLGGGKVWADHTEDTKAEARKQVSIITINELAMKIDINLLRKKE